jgi:hypothetical protein
VFRHGFSGQEICAPAALAPRGPTDTRWGCLEVRTWSESPPRDARLGPLTVLGCVQRRPSGSGQMGPEGFEPSTSRFATERSSSELRPREGSRASADFKTAVVPPKGFLSTRDRAGALQPPDEGTGSAWCDGIPTAYPKPGVLLAPRLSAWPGGADAPRTVPGRCSSWFQRAPCRLSQGLRVFGYPSEAFRPCLLSSEATPCDVFTISGCAGCARGKSKKVQLFLSAEPACT